MEIIFQKRNWRCRQENDLAALYFSSETVFFSHDPNGCSTTNEAILQLSEGFRHYASEQLRLTESHQNGVRHPIYAFVDTVVHRADEKLICVELIFSAKRFQHMIFEKHLLLHFGRCGKQILNSYLLIGKRGRCLRIQGNHAIDTNGKIYLLKKEYRN